MHLRSTTKIIYQVKVIYEESYSIIFYFYVVSHYHFELFYSTLKYFLPPPQLPVHQAIHHIWGVDNFWCDYGKILIIHHHQLLCVYMHIWYEMDANTEISSPRLPFVPLSVKNTFPFSWAIMTAASCVMLMRVDVRVIWDTCETYKQYTRSRIGKRTK